MTRGLRSWMDLSGEVPEMQREKTESFRIRRVMRCVYCDPKSRISTRFDFGVCGSIARR